MIREEHLLQNDGICSSLTSITSIKGLTIYNVNFTTYYTVSQNYLATAVYFSDTSAGLPIIFEKLGQL